MTLKMIAAGDAEKAGHYARLCFRHSRVARPRDVQFAVVDRSVMLGQEHVATAISRNFAQRIAAALNIHVADKRGQ
jgi:hypothetical protein